MGNTFIYLIKSKGNPVYVGRSRNLKQRFYSHKKRFIDAEIIILKECDCDEHFWEMYYITFFEQQGFKLQNFIKP